MPVNKRDQKTESIPLAPRKLLEGHWVQATLISDDVLARQRLDRFHLRRGAGAATAHSGAISPKTPGPAKGGAGPLDVAGRGALRCRNLGAPSTDQGATSAHKRAPDTLTQ